MMEFLRALPFAAACLLVGCGKERAGCLTPLGDPVEKLVMLEAGIVQLKVEDEVDIVWDPNGQGPSAVIAAGEGVVDGIELMTRNGVLHVTDRNTCEWVRDLSAVPEVRLSGIRPDTLDLWGQGRFSMVDFLHGGNLVVRGDEMAGQTDLMFSGDTLQVRMPNGIGHVRVEGTAKRFRSFRSGFGDLDARMLQADQIMLHHAGIGEVHLTGPEYLYLEVAGHGDVHLFGEEGDWNIHVFPGATGQVFWP